ncbi:hypothetical protein Droror1_Dr00025930 [Drosera rotundifolia]
MEEEIVRYESVQTILIEMRFILNLILIIVNLTIEHHLEKYNNKVSYCMKSEVHEQMDFLHRVIGGTDRVCIEQLRMNNLSLCQLIRDIGGLLIDNIYGYLHIPHIPHILHWRLYS